MDIGSSIGDLDGDTLDMAHFGYRNGAWHCEDAPIERIAREVGTPFYVYSRQSVLDEYQDLDAAFGDMPHRICYAVKANANLAVNRVLAEVGCGAEVVSGGELFRALRAGYASEKILFDGNGKTRDELRFALESRIGAINVDFEDELRLLEDVAADMGVVAPIGVRVNPDIDARTHPKIATGLRNTKFGVDPATARACYGYARDSAHLAVRGVHAHIGSQITRLSPFTQLMSALVDLALELEASGIELEYIDVGGGLGVRYDAESPPSYAEYVGALREHWDRFPATVIVEPGRRLVAYAGNLIARVLYVKESPAKRFIVTDAAMNDLWRPSLYGAYHAIVPVNETAGTTVADVVGGVCESGDYLARDRAMADVRAGDLIAVQSAGAYASSMSSEYNSRPLVPEVLVEGAAFRVVRRRPTFEEMVRLEP